jgi:hypothetical protein
MIRLLRTGGMPPTFSTVSTHLGSGVCNRSSKGNIGLCGRRLLSSMPFQVRLVKGQTVKAKRPLHYIR